MLVISYMDGDGVQHFRLDQVCEGAASFQHLTLSLVCHQGLDVMVSAIEYSLYTHCRHQCHVQSMDQGANSGCTQVVSLTHVPWFLTCKFCDVEKHLQLWIDGIYIHIQ